MKTRISLSLLALLSVSLSSGASVDKNGTEDALSSGTSWSGGVVPGSGDVATWNSSSATGTGANPLLLGSDVSWGGISYNFTGSGALFIGGDADRKGVTLGTSGIALTGGRSVTFGSDVSIGGNQTWRSSTRWGAASYVTVLGDLKGNGNLSTNSGEGVTVTFKGKTNGYTGALSIGEWSNFVFEDGLTGGNISIGNDSQLLVSVKGSQTYSSNLSTSAINSGPTFRLAAGSLTLTGTNTFGSGVAAELGSRFSLELIANIGASLSFTTGTSSFGGTTRISGGGAVTFSGTTSFSQNLELSGAGTTVSFRGTTHTISTAGAMVIGTGTTLDLSQGKLTFNGYINKANALLIQGTLKMADFSYGGSLSQLADYSQNRQLDGGSLEITGSSHSSGQGVTISGKGGSFLVTNQNSTLTLNGNGNSSMMDFAGVGTLKLGGAGNMVFNGHANQSFFKGSGVLEKVGSGTLTINGASNGFGGKMILSEGKLVLGHENALGGGSSPTDLVFQGGSLDLGNLALRNVTIEFDGGTPLNVLNGANFLGLLNVGRSGSYTLSSATSFGSGFKASVDTEFTLEENRTVGFKVSGLKNYIFGVGSVGFTGEGYNLSVSNYGAIDGAVKASSLSFHDMGDISFSGNTSTSVFGWGGAMTAENGMITFEQVGNITFTGNQANGTIDDGLGGAFYAFGGVSMSGVKNVTFSSNSSTYSGGAVATEGEFSVLNAGAVVFENNASKNGAGGAVFVGQGGLSLDSVVSLSAKKNTAKESGGAFYAENDISLSAIASDIEFLENSSVDMNGGAISSNGGSVYFSSVGDVSFKSNTAGRDGGAIHAYNDVVFDGVGKVTFEGNSAENGGAVSAYSVTLQGLKGDVVFRNNEALMSGGALFIGSQVDLTADGGDISFIGNTAAGGERNSIHFDSDGAISNLDALEGHSIVFEDGWSTVDEYAMISVSINGKGEDSRGEVRMTGEGSQMNVRANTTVSRGSFIVEKGANYGYNSSNWSQEDASLKTEFLIDGGVVVAGQDSSINANRFSLSKGAELCVVQSAVVRAETIDINGGLVTAFHGGFGQAGQPGGSLQADTININGISLDLNGSPVSFSGAVINLGGTIVLNDSLIDYTSLDWVADRQFVLASFGDEMSTINGMFGGIISEASGTRLVYDPEDSGHLLGGWTFGWDDRDLVASWTTTPLPVPEPASFLLVVLACAAGAMRRSRKPSL